MIVIEAKNLGKKYKIGERERYLALRDTLTFMIKHPFKWLRGKLADITGSGTNDYWALKDINFKVEKGEVLGIIGHNGAGKSTLLKILSQITPPTTGEIRLNGRAGSLLEVGTGFHPELTGRENIYLNGAILGMRKKEIEKKFDEIVEFSGIGEFLDTPVKRYSSGMYVRLAFSVAAHLEPDILIIDEVLAVGDAEFQKKCLGKMEEVTSKEGRTVLFVSHNMNAVRSLCHKAILLNKGVIERYGDCNEVVDAYIAGHQQKNLVYSPSAPMERNGIVLSGAQLFFEGDELNNGKELTFKAKIELKKGQKFAASLFVYRGEELAFLASNFHDCPMNEELKPGNYELVFTIPPYLLNPGFHSLGLVISDHTGNMAQLLNVMNVIQFDLSDDGARRNSRYQLGWSGAVSPLLKTKIICLD